MGEIPGRAWYDSTAANHLSCSTIFNFSHYALHEMDRPGGSNFISRVLFYSLGIYPVGQYYGEWNRYGRHQLWQARLFSFCIGGTVPALHFYTTGVGQTAQLTRYCTECGLGGAEYFCTGGLFGWRMPPTPNRYLADAAGIDADAGIGPFP